jgi:hypothetical protein
MTSDSDPHRAGPGPDDMGDDEQESEIQEYQRYLDDPLDDLTTTESDDNDVEEAAEWAARHPRAAGTVNEPGDESAGESAVPETRDR